MDSEQSWSMVRSGADRSTRSPFRDAELSSRRRSAQLSDAGQFGADNLLSKALRALDSGDGARASALIDRAVRLPFDEHEQAAPAALSAHMSLFRSVVDALERSDETDERWLDAALEVLPSADRAAACDLRDVLMAVDQDYLLSRAEHRRLRTALASVPARPELRDLTLNPPELHDQILSVLTAVRAYRAALGRRPA